MAWERGEEKMRKNGGRIPCPHQGRIWLEHENAAARVRLDKAWGMHKNAAGTSVVAPNRRGEKRRHTHRTVVVALGSARFV
uniref:Uncharacterized protein n=1 Tax=Oryza rufipogon TaxID=4529 RepID=A0A0E0PV35_ORYRU